MGCSSVPVNHVIAAWAENRSIKWYLGILEKESDEGLLVSYLVSTDDEGKCWELPESPEIWKTAPVQVLAYNVEVEYFGTVNFRCKIISDSLIKQMKKRIKQLHA